MRALAYAQGAAVLGFIPILGYGDPLMDDSDVGRQRCARSAGSTVKAVIFIVVGGAVTVVAMMVLSPILMRTLVRILS